MRILLFTLFTLGLLQPVLAQVDIANARANPKTFIFDDDKHTVHGYIYNTLQAKTSCCGTDAIYLEVKFDQSGTVTSAKTLTGKTECYKKSIVDIVQNVKWDATGVTGSKTIYFEVKPILPCSGSPGENVYRAVSGGGSVASTQPVNDNSNQTGNGGNLTDAADKEVKTAVVEKIEPVVVKSEPVVVKEVKKEVVEDFLSDDQPVKEPVKPVATKVEPVKEVVKPVAVKEVVKPVAKTAPIATAAVTKPGGPIKLPPQQGLEYVSKGDVKPDVSHNTTFANNDIKGVANVQYADEGTFAVALRANLRKSGFCGLAQATVELEIDPSSGSVVNSRVMRANDPKVGELVPSAIKDLKFKPTSSPANRYIYSEFKTEIVCEGQKPKYNLDQVEDFLTKPTASGGN